MIWLKGKEKMDKIAVLIPCYNEELTIGKVIEDVKEKLPEAVIYVYDNNSTDNTYDVAKQMGAIARRETLQGKGNVIRRMFREIDAECYLMVDGDNTYSLEKASVMIDMVLEQQVDMVVGDRLSSTYFEENKRPFHNVGNSLVRASVNLLFDCEIKDIMTGLRAFSYEFVKTFPVLSKGFEIETEMTIHAVFHHMNIKNVVIEYRDREEGSVSKLNTIPDGLKVLGTIIRMMRNYKPMLFFSGIAIFLVLIALVLIVPVFLTYFETGLVPRFPTLIVCGFMVMAGLQSVFTGVLLSVMLGKEQRDFEMELLHVYEYRLIKKMCK